MAQVSSLAAEERRTWLLQELQASRAVSLADAAASLGVSEMTVRRDLSSLEKSGVARRVRGGAVYNGPVSFQGRDREHAEAKQIVAEKLLPFVPERGVIAMDSSTTMHRLARMITDRDNLVVVTNGLVTFQVLHDRAGITPILTGGATDRRSDSLIGPVATAFLESMRFVGFFASAAAVDATATFEDTLEEADIKRAFARSSSRVFLGVHAQKLDEDATAQAVRLDRVDALATDLDPTEPRLAPYHEHVPDVL